MKPSILTCFFLFLLHSSFGQTDPKHEKNTILKLEMNLSAMGVESDDFPSILVTIDFTENTNSCKKSYYNPAYKDEVYYLTDGQMEEIKALLENTKLETLKAEYTIPYSDQPTSTTKIYTIEKTYVIKDYGLKGDETLTKLYKLVYRINE